MRTSEAMRHRLRGLLPAAVAVAVMVDPAGAQPTPTVAPAPQAPREPAPSRYERLSPTLVATVAVRPVTLTLEGSRRATDTGLIGEFGVRINPIAALCAPRPGRFCRVASRLTVEPHASLGATHLRGIDARAGESSFANFELLGIRAAYAAHPHLVPFGLYRRGTHTSEQFEGNDVVNLWGPGTTRGVGLIVPITRLRRGISITISEHRGTFEQVEFRNLVADEKVISATRRPFSATSWQIGWSGPFTGVTWPWQ